LESTIDLALNILRRFPLCDSCLGRMFSTLLRGFTNEERGKAIKMAIAMDMLRKMEADDTEAKKTLEEIAPSLDENFSETLHSAGIERTVASCYICGGALKRWKLLYKEALSELKNSSAESFLVGVTVPRTVEEKEETVVKTFSLLTAESIRSELRREIGKAISASLGIPAEFKSPGAVVQVNIEENRVYVKVNPLFVRGRYIKAGRNISQIRWFDEPEPSDSLSIEKMISILKEVYEKSEIVLHASGREDVDVRMLGSGRPFIIEIKNPKTRRLNLRLVSDLLNRASPYGKFMIDGRGKREDVRTLKMMDSRKLKVYRLIAFSEKSISTEDIEAIVRGLKGTIVRQRTPIRVVKRRADAIRLKKVHDISLAPVGDKAITGLIVADGGLYIKELVSGDVGRTEPSFTSLTGKQMQCIELDVVKVFL